MKTFKVLGIGCAKCKKTVQLIEETARKSGVEVQVEKIEDPETIMGFGVMSTPAVIVGDAVVHSGSIPRHDQVEAWLAA
ncbi:MAG: thioredoxin family protein [Thalassolituus sp.]